MADISQEANISANVHGREVARITKEMKCDDVNG